MVEGYWHIESSGLFSDEEKNILKEKLEKKINANGFLLVKSQTDRSQLGNKLEVIKKLNLLVNKALIKRKARKATQPSKASVEKRIEIKKKIGTLKDFRKKVSRDTL
jgi:ribosome-associated protein